MVIARQQLCWKWISFTKISKYGAASDTVLFTSENNDIANQGVDTSFFTSEKNGMTNQLASLARRDYFYLDDFGA